MQLKILLILLILNVSVSTYGAIPDLVCQVVAEEQIDNKSLSTTTYDSKGLYKFSKDKLYLSSPDRDEYEYGEINEVEYLRYNVGYKTIIFNSDKFKNAVVVHFDKYETRVLQISCL